MRRTKKSLEIKDDWGKCSTRLTLTDEQKKGVRRDAGGSMAAGKLAVELQAIYKELARRRVMRFFDSHGIRATLNKERIAELEKRQAKLMGEKL